MRIWIDATRHDEEIKIFGMTLLERTLRSLLEAQKQVKGLQALEEKLRGLSEARAYIRDFVGKRLSPSEVRVELSPDGGIVATLVGRVDRQATVESGLHSCLRCVVLSANVRE